MGHTWEAKLENKKKLTVEDARYIFEQAEKFLIDLNNSHGMVVDRTNNLLALFVTILTALIGFNVARIEPNGLENDNITCSIWILVAYLVVGTLSLARNVRPRNYMGIGTSPINLFNDVFFVETVTDNERVIRMLVSEIERYQFRIEVNTEINNKKWKVVTIGIYWLLAIPIVFLFSYLLFLIT